MIVDMGVDLFIANVRLEMALQSLNKDPIPSMVV
jgi:hypothetical protein